MSTPKTKSLRLSFKGDKPIKKRKRTDKHAHAESSSSSSRKRKAGDASVVEEVGGDEQAWVGVETEQDLNGPCFLFHQQQSDAPSHCVAFQPTLQSVEAAVVLPSTDESAFDDRAGLLASDPKLAEELEGAEIVPASSSSSATNLVPTSVYQVWVATKVPGSSSPTRFTFKSAEGKFLGADKSGLLRASMEARGPQEEWILEPSDRGVWKLRSVHGLYLGLDQVAGGKTVVRADCDPTDPEAQWTLRVQWKHRHAARHSADAKPSLQTKANDPTAVQLGTRDQIVAQELQTFRSRAGSQYIPSNYSSSLSKEERRALRKAEKEGRLAEEMLDRRSKLKSDKYA